MKKSLIFLSIFIIAFIAFFDAKDRLQELDEVAANTPSQVEMKQMINKPDAPYKRDNMFNQNNANNWQQKMHQNNNGVRQNQLDNVDRRRDSIKNQMQ